MCRIESRQESKRRRRWGVMGLKAAAFGGERLEKLRNSGVVSRSRIKLWIIRATTTVLLWTCIVQLTALGESWGPLVLKGWPSFFSQESVALDAYSLPEFPVRVLPPKRVYKNNGYLMVSCNGGLNQMRAAICDMVAIARYLNVTLIVPELDRTSFWNDPSEFQDIFDIDHFITSLRDEVRILKDLPPRVKKRVEQGIIFNMPPISWSDISYYQSQILPLIQKYKVVHLNRTDARLANNGLPIEIQKLRCRVNFNVLKFTPEIEELGRKVVKLLRQKGPVLVLHLRYEMDMLAFSGCTQGCSTEEVEELTRMRAKLHNTEKELHIMAKSICTCFLFLVTLSLISSNIKTCESARNLLGLINPGIIQSPIFTGILPSPIFSGIIPPPLFAGLPNIPGIGAALSTEEEEPADEDLDTLPPFPSIPFSPTPPSN